MKRTIKYSLIVVSILIILFVLLIVVAPLFGWRVDAATGDSMTPVLKSGGIVVTQPVETSDIVLGDIITYLTPEYNELVIHRVVDIVDIIEDDSLLFQTKGDAKKIPTLI